jgi:hypothetical protein
MGRKPKAGGPAKPKEQSEERPQIEDFIETARKLGVDETGETFEKAFRRLVPPKRKLQRDPS